MYRQLLVLIIVLLLSSFIQAAPFHDAIQNGEVDSVRSALNSNPELLSLPDEAGYLPIHYACYYNQLEMAKDFLSLGADVNSRSGGGSTPLHGASYYGHKEIVDWLLDNGADINAQNQRGWPPIFSGAFSQTRETLDILLDNGADLNIGDERNAQLIHYLSWLGDTQRVLNLIDRGVDINQKHDELDTPITWAIEADNIDLYDSLYNRGADLTIVNDEGRTLAHYLAYRGQADRLKDVIEKGLDPEMPDSSGRTPIFNAVSGGDLETIKLLVELNVDVNHKSNDGDRPITSAFGIDSTSTFEYFLSCGVDVNAPLWADNNTPLLVSIFWERPECTKILLENGADPNLANEQGNTPLMEAVNSCKTEITGLLLNAGADPNMVESHYGHSPLHKAAIMGDPLSAELLVAHGADLDYKDNAELSAIDYAVKYRQKTVEDYLASNGAKSIVKANKGNDLKKSLKDGEMTVWYLGHCGYGVKTANHLLIFDYWKGGRMSADPCLENGFVTVDQIKDQDVYVFVSHEHRDHYDQAIWQWANEAKSIHYVYGFQPENMRRMEPENMFAAYEGPEYTYTAPRTTTEIDDIKITTIAANDAGVGFVVDVDGLVLFHAGDHAGWNEDGREDYLAEIDFIAENTEWIDMAFINVTGCHTHCEIALREGLFYALDTLDPRSWSPTHAGGNEYRYTDFLNMDECEKWREKVACPCHAGDSFFYSEKKIKI